MKLWTFERVILKLTLNPSVEDLMLLGLQFGESVEDYVCLTTVRRHVIDRLRWSRKKLERRHRDAIPLAQLRYMQAMGSRDP